MAAGRAEHTDAATRGTGMKTTFPSVTLEGGLFAPDLFEQMLSSAEDRSASFGLDSRMNLVEHISGVYMETRALWKRFQDRMENLPPDDPGTSLTRDFMTAFLARLGHALQLCRSAREINGKSYFISHFSGTHDAAPPVHIVGCRQDLNRVAESGRPRLAPHSLVQEYLNVTEALWGLVTNGKVIRLLRNSTYLRRLCYVEFDLDTLFDQELFQDFQLLFRLLHASRFPRPGQDPETCPLEEHYQHGVEQGGRIRDKLRDGVEQALKLLADGFLQHPKNDALREYLRARSAPNARIIPAGEFYSDLLRIVYRFLFLLVSEDRGLISNDKTYLDHYSVVRLRALIRRPGWAEDRHEDLWHGFRVLWHLLRDDRPIPQAGGKPLATLLGLQVLNGDLFKDTLFDRFAPAISNTFFLRAMKALLYYDDNGTERPVNYAALDVEELGSVYESLLEYRPVILRDPDPWHFELSPGSERKETGSYYTPRELVNALLEETLTPVIREKLKGRSTREQKEEALLSIRVVDPACGSGHFLLAAARRIAQELARVRTGEDEPSPEPVRQALRDVIARCVYGVDLNPLAVDLCRVALWMEAQVPGKPLTFLDHHIRCGNSLIGVHDMKQVEQGIPDSAFKDLKKCRESFRKSASQLRKSNKAGNQDLAIRQGLLFAAPEETLERLAGRMEALSQEPDDSPRAIHRKRDIFEQLQRDTYPARLLCNLWTAAFFQGFTDGLTPETAITTRTIHGWLEREFVDPQIKALTDTLASQYRFFHWPLEFPRERGGFDVVVGNPPWERLEKQSAGKKQSPPDNAEAENENPESEENAGAADHSAPEGTGAGLAGSDSIDAQIHFFHHSEAYPLTGKGILNTYSLFTERALDLAGSRGWLGLVVPTGIATDLSNSQCFAALVKNGRLEAVLDFENRKKLFPAVDSRFRFCLLVLRPRAEARSDQPARFMFYLTAADQARDRNRRIQLTPAQLSRLNPDSGTCPVFRTAQDAQLTLDLYQRLPVLEGGKDTPGPWRARFLTLFQMGGPSMKGAETLRRQGLRPQDNRFVGAGKEYLPVYEGKLFWQYNHRHASYAAARGKPLCRETGETDLRNPACSIHPQYWVEAGELEARLADWPRPWLLAWRDITQATNARTVVCAILPRWPAGDKVHILCTPEPAPRIAALLAWLNSLVLDYLARQKISGANLKHGHMRQLPVLPPESFDEAILAFVVPRVVALTCAAWDVMDFGADVWKEASPPARQALERLRLSFKDWDGKPVTREGKSYPFPPFPWNPECRARLQAELDAWFAARCGLNRKQLRYLLDPADLTPGELRDLMDPAEEVDDPLDPEEYKTRRQASTFEGETFRVLRDNELKEWGKYRTRRLVLEAWKWMHGARR